MPPAFLALLFLYDFAIPSGDFLLPAQFGDRYAGDGARFYSYLTSPNALTVIFMTPVVTSLVSGLRPLTAVAIGGGLFCAAYLCFGTGGTFPVYIAAAGALHLGEISETIQRWARIWPTACPAVSGENDLAFHHRARRGLGRGPGVDGEAI